jgi:hypothetical protein
MRKIKGSPHNKILLSRVDQLPAAALTQAARNGETTESFGGEGVGRAVSGQATHRAAAETGDAAAS